jgi:predicted RNA-binding Zn-ribbon protein involved in translation (DUF1610 family)
MLIKRDESMSNLNQAQFDERFTNIVKADAAVTGLKKQGETFGTMKPIRTQASVTCQECDEEINVKAKYHPDENKVSYNCPECKEKNVEEHNWFDVKGNGKMYSPHTGEEITPDNIKKHL